MRVTTEETVIKSTIAVMRMFCSDQIVAFLWHPPTPRIRMLRLLQIYSGLIIALFRELSNGDQGIMQNVLLKAY